MTIRRSKQATPYYTDEHFGVCPICLLAEKVHAITHSLMDIREEDVFSSPALENLLGEVRQLLPDAGKLQELAIPG